MKTFSRTLLASVIASSTLPMAAHAADGLDYTYLEGAYTNLDIDGYDDGEGGIEDFDDGSGFALKGSLALSEQVFTFANYSETDADASFRDGNNAAITSDQDVKRFDLGLGLRAPLNTNSTGQTDLVGRIAYTDIDYGDFDFGASGNPAVSDLDDDNSDGYFADAAVRTELTDRLEGSAGLRYTDIERADNVSFIGNLLFSLTPDWGLNFEVDAGDEIGVYSLGVRYDFN